ncbi:MAG: riboflavin synthase [Bacteroidetes bacterium]|nr:riboflavin synthase [Bacteroidota bacterium]MBK8658103.1 riboflavin synthase [Bacteroidota bacterium]
MFTGIIEGMGRIVALTREAGNLHLTVESAISGELKIDQSVAHNGVCLTVVGLQGQTHTVTAIAETLSKTNLGSLQINDTVNLERCTRVGDRLDGHIVQGHVDQTGTCVSVVEQNGSWLFTFQYSPGPNHVVVEKGSVCINGISLTAFNANDNLFSVAIIPYTWQHTNMQHVRAGDAVNLEFDIIGKYVARMMGFAS